MDAGCSGENEKFRTFFIYNVVDKKSRTQIQRQIWRKCPTYHHHRNGAIFMAYR